MGRQEFRAPNPAIGRQDCKAMARPRDMLCSETSVRMVATAQVKARVQCQRTRGCGIPVRMREMRRKQIDNDNETDSSVNETLPFTKLLVLTNINYYTVYNI